MVVSGFWGRGSSVAGGGVFRILHVGPSKHDRVERFTLWVFGERVLKFWGVARAVKVAVPLGGSRVPSYSFRTDFHMIYSCFSIEPVMCITRDIVKMHAPNQDGSKSHLRFPIWTPRVVRTRFNAREILALLTNPHDAIVFFRFSLASGQERHRTKCHELREGEPVGVCTKTGDSRTEVSTVFKAAFLVAPMQNAEAACGTDLGQAHEVELIGVVDVDEHLHPGHEERERHTGTSGQTFQKGRERNHLIKSRKVCLQLSAALVS